MPACHAGGPGSIPGRCSSIIEEVLGLNVYITSQIFFYWDVTYTLRPSTSSQPTSNTPPPTTAIFRTFKKSRALYKVHNMGLRYIKNLKIHEGNHICILRGSGPWVEQQVKVLIKNWADCDNCLRSRGQSMWKG